MNNNYLRFLIFFTAFYITGSLTYIDGDFGIVFRKPVFLFTHPDILLHLFYALILSILWTLVSFKKKWILSKQDYLQMKSDIADEIVKMPYKQKNENLFRMTYKEVILTGAIKIKEKDDLVIIMGPYYYIHQLQKKFKKAEYPLPSL